MYFEVKNKLTKLQVFRFIYILIIIFLYKMYGCYSYEFFKNYYRILHNQL